MNTDHPCGTVPGESEPKLIVAACTCNTQAANKTIGSSCFIWFLSLSGNLIGGFDSAMRKASNIVHLPGATTKMPFPPASKLLEFRNVERSSLNLLIVLGGES